jgi:hypothetical protein
MGADRHAEGHLCALDDFLTDGVLRERLANCANPQGRRRFSMFRSSSSLARLRKRIR